MTARRLRHSATNFQTRSNSARPRARGNAGEIIEVDRDHDRRAPPCSSRGDRSKPTNAATLRETNRPRAAPLPDGRRNVRRLLSAASARRSGSTCRRAPRSHSQIGAGMSGSIQLKHWITPVSRQRSSSSRRSSTETTRRSRSRSLSESKMADASLCASKWMSVISSSRSRCSRQPVKRTGVAVLYIDRQRDRRRRGPPRRSAATRTRAIQRIRHRAGWIFGFFESLPRNSTRRNAGVARRAAAMHSFDHQLHRLSPASRSRAPGSG